MSWSGGGVVGSVGYGWSNFGLLSSITVNNSVTLNMSYNYDGQLTDAASVLYGYHAQNGYLESVATGNLSSAHTYSSYGELATSTNKDNTTNIVSFSYTRDALGRLSSMTRTTPSLTQTTSYVYDGAGQLLSETTGSTTKSYTYSDSGNRFTTGGAEVYDAQDRLVSDSQWTYTYNKNGYLSRKDHVSNGSYVTYTYDVLGNLTAVIYSNGTRVDYVVDGMNRRIQRKLNNAFSANFIYLDDLRPIAQLNSNGSIKSTFVYGSKPNVPDLMIQGTVRYRIISDHLGSPQYVVRESNGQVVQAITYDTWGKVLTDTNPGFQPFGFAGGIYDVTTGLVRFGARDYDPSIGRWLNKDPIRQAGGMNLYAYVKSDPINFYDPTGLSRLVYDPKTKTILVYPDGEGPPQSFPANNETTRNDSYPYMPEGNGPAPVGEWPMGSWVDKGNDPTGPYGAGGFIPIGLPKSSPFMDDYVGPQGRTGVGVHAGRVNSPRGPGRALTQGCVRTTEAGMKALRSDPPRTIKILGK
jgi:RHS repeat-associated protein